MTVGLLLDRLGRLHGSAQRVPFSTGCFVCETASNAAVSSRLGCDRCHLSRGPRKQQARVPTQISAEQPTLLVIDTHKRGGPFIGTFAASGAFVDGERSRSLKAGSPGWSPNDC